MTPARLPRTRRRRRPGARDRAEERERYPLEEVGRRRPEREADRVATDTDTGDMLAHPALVGRNPDEVVQEARARANRAELRGERSLHGISDHISRYPCVRRRREAEAAPYSERVGPPVRRDSRHRRGELGSQALSATWASSPAVMARSISSATGSEAAAGSVGSSVKMGMTSFATFPCRAAMRSSAVRPSPMYSRTYRPDGDGVADRVTEAVRADGAGCRVDRR